MNWLDFGWKNSKIVVCSPDSENKKYIPPEERAVFPLKRDFNTFLDGFVLQDYTIVLTSQMPGRLAINPVKCLSPPVFRIIAPGKTSDDY